MRRRGPIFVLALLVPLGIGLLYARSRKPPATPVTDRAEAPRLVRSSVDAPAPAVPQGARVLLVGGGAEPGSGGVQLEQDLTLATQTLAGPGVVLFGGGRSTFSVREDGPEPRFEDPLRQRLAELFDPRDRGATYRRTRLHPDAPATAEVFLETLEAMLTSPGEPVVVFVATHGEQGDGPLDTSLVLWGGGAITPRDLLALDAKPEVQRGSRLVLTSCHGGAFGDIAVGESEESMPTGDHCGVFATTWDHVASGCDTNPDRSAQEGYAIHFFAALRGQDRDGHALPRTRIDFDGDGSIGLLDAHTFVRVRSHSFDVPTTTSERFLRARMLDRGPAPRNEAPVDDPYEDAVIRAIGAELDAPDAQAAEAVRERLDDALTDAENALLDAGDARDGALADVRIELLERYPELDDPWNPRMHELLETHRADIEALLARSLHVRAYAEAGERENALADAVDRARIALARAERLVAAYETKRLAASLRARDPESFARYESLRRCERFVPALQH